MQYIINKNGIAFIVSIIGLDLAKLEGCTVYPTLYDMNVDMDEENIGFEYLITREDESEKVMMFTQFSGETIKIETERFISEFVL